MDFIQLRQKYKELRYEGYQSNWSAEKPEFCFEYSLIEENGKKIEFKHRLRYEMIAQGQGVSLAQEPENQQQLANFVFQIGLAETINYWKLACPKRLVIACGKIANSELGFWKKLYYNGLGEFIYLNGIHQLKPEITQDNLVDIISLGEELPIIHGENFAGNLIPVGGGKDSVVTLELLKMDRERNLPFVMSPPQAAYDCIEVAGYDRYLLATRVLDAKIIEMNQAGYLNGHVPFSAILAFISALGAALTGKRYIVLSNEKSANEPSVAGTNFNHQYSKTLEFEKDFTHYFQTQVMPEIHYFSLLRGMYEIEIAQAFAKYEQYHCVFRSCNRGKKTNQWCGKCSKCLFVYIILGPYIERNRLQQIFGKNLLEDPELEPILWELIGLGETKPFECVGTMWEVQYALNQTAQQYGYSSENEHTPILMHKFLKAGLSQSQPDQNYELGDCIPEHFKSLLN